VTKADPRRGLVLGASALALVILVTLGASLVVGDPAHTDLASPAPPTDRDTLARPGRLGRDVLARVAHGARISFGVAGVVVVVRSSSASSLGPSPPWPAAGPTSPIAGRSTSCSRFQACSSRSHSPPCAVPAPATSLLALSRPRVDRLCASHPERGGAPPAGRRSSRPPRRSARARCRSSSATSSRSRYPPSLVQATFRASYFIGPRSSRRRVSRFS
jgi:hypothetical protein